VNVPSGWRRVTEFIVVERTMSILYYQILRPQYDTVLVVDRFFTGAKLIQKGIVLKPGKHPRKIESNMDDSGISASFSEKDWTELN
jgi:hypothetical protein